MKNFFKVIFAVCLISSVSCISAFATGDVVPTNHCGEAIERYEISPRATNLWGPINLHFQFNQTISETVSPKKGVNLKMQILVTPNSEYPDIANNHCTVKVYDGSKLILSKTVSSNGKINNFTLVDPCDGGDYKISITSNWYNTASVAVTEYEHI